MKITLNPYFELSYREFRTKFTMCIWAEQKFLCNQLQLIRLDTCEHYNVISQDPDLSSQHNCNGQRGGQRGYGKEINRLCKQCSDLNDNKSPAQKAALFKWLQEQHQTSQNANFYLQKFLNQAHKNFHTKQTQKNDFSAQQIKIERNEKILRKQKLAIEKRKDFKSEKKEEKVAQALPQPYGQEHKIELARKDNRKLVEISILYENQQNLIKKLILQVSKLKKRLSAATREEKASEKKEKEQKENKAMAENCGKKNIKSHYYWYNPRTC